VEAARYQPSALSFPNNRRDLSHFAKQNFFAKCKEVIDKESAHPFEDSIFSGRTFHEQEYVMSVSRIVASVHRLRKNNSHLGPDQYWSAKTRSDTP
jgi:hypothetical protein